MGPGIVLQVAAADARIEVVAAEAPFANLQEAAYDCAGLQRWPLLGKTFFAPGAWIVVFRGEHLAGFPASEVFPRKGRGEPCFFPCCSSVMPQTLGCHAGIRKAFCERRRRSFGGRWFRFSMSSGSV
jgi:hypothetical protein